MSTLNRKVYFDILNHLPRKEYSILTGARQTGKSTVLLQLREYLEKKGEEVYFVSLEDPALLTELDNHPGNIFRFVRKPDHKRVFMLIDEIQYLKNPSNFPKLLYDKYSEFLKIIATGSSAFYIDEKFRDSLAGRKKIFELYTLDFEEFLTFKGHGDLLLKEWNQIKDDENYISLSRNDIMQFFREYITYGGYPQVVLAEEVQHKKELLKELFTSYLKKDAQEANIQYQGKFLNLLILLAHQSGSLLNINELSNTLAISSTAINNYIHLLQKSFHIHLVKPFYNNVRKELTKMPKVYFNDLGFRNIAMNMFSAPGDRIDKGIVVENYIYIRLRQLYTSENIYFWRTADSAEVDFIVSHNNRRFAIESKFNAREFRPSSYNRFVNAYPDIPLHCRAFLSETNKNDILAL